jgi:hypothetical protein
VTEEEIRQHLAEGLKYGEQLPAPYKNLAFVAWTHDRTRIIAVGHSDFRNERFNRASILNIETAVTSVRAAV